ncbi:Protein AF-9 [Varanus komodoensis]|nr:Protein AF-9 [Varanus komodoensis]
MSAGQPLGSLHAHLLNIIVWISVRDKTVPLAEPSFQLFFFDDTSPPPVRRVNVRSIKDWKMADTPLHIYYGGGRGGEFPPKPLAVNLPDIGIVQAQNPYSSHRYLMGPQSRTDLSPHPYCNLCKDPPYKVEESGYAGFILPIEVYFKNKEEPKKVRFDYDLFLHLEGHPPVNHLRCEKLTFNNPTEEFRKKLLKAGGIMVMSDGTSAASGQSLHLPNLPSNSLSFSEVKKKSSHGPKDPNKSVSTSSSSSNSFSKPHKLTKEHKEKPSKDSKEHKSAFKEPSREHNKSSKESSKKPKENKPLKDEKIVPKMAFKEPKPMSKEPKSENNILTITGGQQQEKKAPTKRPPGMDSEDLSAKKKKKSGSEALFKSFSTAPPLILTCSTADKKQTKDKSQFKIGKVKMESETLEKKKNTLPPFDDIVDPNDSDMEENMSSKSESEQPSPASSSSSSSSSFTPSQNSRQQGPLRSIMKDLHSDDNEDESDEADENDNDSEMERPVNTHGGNRGGRRVSLSDGSDSDSSSASSPLRHEPPPLLKTNSNQILEVKSPIKQSKSDKQIKNGDCDKAYLDELVELHRRLMTLRERHVLQQIVNLIEETGHFHITNTTFDFDLCSLDKTTVRKLQSYLETSGAS